MAGITKIRVDNDTVRHADYGISLNKGRNTTGNADAGSQNK
ncbi:hypothetical protein ACQ86N_28565 [Puia sp. P3]